MLCFLHYHLVIFSLCEFLLCLVLYREKAIGALLDQVHADGRSLEVGCLQTQQTDNWLSTRPTPAHPPEHRNWDYNNIISCKLAIRTGARHYKSAESSRK